MRITNRYMTSTIISSIQNNLSTMARSQEQLATKKRLLRPSDDPNVMGQFLSLKSGLTYMEQYNKNIDDGLSYLDMSDTSMGTLGDILSKASEFAIQSANDTYSAEDRVAIAEQIGKLIDEVVDLANSTVGGKYIYAGTNNNSPPFSRVGDLIVYSGDTNEIRREVLAGTDYRIDSPGITTSGIPGVFGSAVDNGDGTYNVSDGSTTPASGDGIFQVLFELRNSLFNNDAAGIQGSISNLQDQTDSLLGYRVQVGARTSHFETLQSMLLDQEIKLTANLENIEGADMERLAIEYSQQQVAYEAALAAGAKMMQVSLLDFLR
ncbi:flagellar hook-associated protein FlgL [Pelotomaculum propionicicum]|uniref:flagellar hook-associated protein FlgL n=1 Tax=Pelotomaculum propionicicum TaxID=258475 RepID=UPI003B7EB875